MCWWNLRCTAEHTVALRTEGVDRNNMNHDQIMEVAESPSVRRAWIEMFQGLPGVVVWLVALRTEGVDRNVNKNSHKEEENVALRTEGVDRNENMKNGISNTVGVALRTEGVDRNSPALADRGLSSRRPPYGGRG